MEKEAIDARVEEQLQIVLELIKENKQLDKLKDRQLESTVWKNGKAKSYPSSCLDTDM